MQARDIFLALQDGQIGVEEARRLLSQSTDTTVPEEVCGLVLAHIQHIDEVQISPWPVGPPAADEISVAVRASAVNFPDTMCVRGLYPTMPDYPFVPGFEVAGVVAEVGAQVQEFKPGDAVVALTGMAMGGHAGMVNLPAANAVHKPSHITFEDICSLPVAFCTVDYAFRRARLNRGEHLLIHTATGGCGLVALQLAALAGAVTYTSSSRSSKRLILHTLESPHVLDYNSPFDQEIAEMTGGRGVDVVLNMISGPAIQKGLNSLACGGRYVELAVHALKTVGPLNLAHLTANQSFYSIDLRKAGAALKVRDSLTRMVQLLEQRRLVPINSRIYPLHEMRNALDFVSQGAHVGKVIVSHTHGDVIDSQDRLLVNMLDQKHRAEEQSHHENPYAEVAL